MTPPTSVAWPTPETFSRRFLITWSARVVSSRSGLAVEEDEAVTATDAIGKSSGLKRLIFGSLISSRSVGRTKATFSRTSCAASFGSTVRSNSMMTTERPS
jgi:hypothetical protein